MATRIDLNKDEGFCGAFVIVPPGDGDPQELLVLNNKEDPAMFWSLVRTRAEMEMNALAEAERQPGYGARR